MIASQVARQNAQPGDFAVMYRTNAQSRLLEEAFLHAGLPYKLVGAQRFYGRREVKDVIAYLRLVHNPDDEVSLSRVINVPTRGIGSKTLFNATHIRQPGWMLSRRAAAANRAREPVGALARILRSSRHGPLEFQPAFGRLAGVEQQLTPAILDGSHSGGCWLPGLYR